MMEGCPLCRMANSMTPPPTPSSRCVPNWLQPTSLRIADSRLAQKGSNSRPMSQRRTVARGRKDKRAGWQSDDGVARPGAGLRRGQREAERDWGKVARGWREAARQQTAEMGNEGKAEAAQGRLTTACSGGRGASLSSRAEYRSRAR